jgi:threonyl-tRNA synthetase
MPERFDLTFVAPDGSRKRPVVIHRVLFGSIERFIAILIEHFAGDLPLWLAPVQANVISINEEYEAYAYKVRDALRAAGLRVQVDSRNESLNYRIRESEMMKFPYALVVGKKEAESDVVSVRNKKSGKIATVKLEDLASELAGEISDKTY